MVLFSESVSYFSNVFRKLIRFCCSSWWGPAICIFLLPAVPESKAQGFLQEQSFYFRVDAALAIRTDSLVGIAITTPSDQWAPDSAYRFTDARMALSQIRSNTAKSDLFIRINIRNIHSNDLVGAVRHYGVFHHTQVRVINNGTGRQTAGSSIESSFYGASRIVIPSGSNTMDVVYRGVRPNTAASHIDLVPPSLLADDQSEHFITYRKQIIPLIIFDFLLAFQILYILIQLYYHKKVEYFHYFSFLVSVGLFFVLRLVVSMRIQPFYDSFIDLFSVINSTLLVAPYFFYLMFARRFLELSSRHPQMNRLIQIGEYFVIASVVAIGVISFLINFQAAYFIAYGSVIVLFLFTIYLILFFFKQKDPLSRFMLIGSSFATTGHAVAMTISVFGEIDAEGYSPMIATMTGVAFEIFYFNTGLGFKSKYEQSEKLKAQAALIGQLEENRKIQDRLQDMRNRIASDLHDDVGSTLSSIGLYSEVAARQLDSDPQTAKSILHKISDSSRRMMEAMSDIVWAIHSRQDEAGSLSTRMTRFATERLSPSGIGFRLNKDHATDQLYFTIEARRSLLLLFKEAVNNAAKYSGAKVVSANLSIRNGVFEMIVEDDGKGFDPGSNQQGNGLITMRSRAVELGGILTIESLPGLGTKVIVTVPVASLAIAPGANHVN